MLYKWELDFSHFSVDAVVVAVPPLSASVPPASGSGLTTLLTVLGRTDLPFRISAMSFRDMSIIALVSAFQSSYFEGFPSNFGIPLMNVAMFLVDSAMISPTNERVHTYFLNQFSVEKNGLDAVPIQFENKPL